MARVVRSGPYTYKEFQILWQSLSEQNFDFLSIREVLFRNLAFPSRWRNHLSALQNSERKLLPRGRVEP